MFRPVTADTCLPRSSLASQLGAHLAAHCLAFVHPPSPQLTVTSVIGAPIEVQKTEGEPTDEQVQALLDTYIDAIQKLFDEHKKSVLGQDFEGELKIL